MVYIIILTVLCMKVIGEMIFNTAKVKNLGLMALSMRDTTWPVKNMEWDFTAGMMVASTLENGMKTKLKDLEHTAGSMEDNIKENGLIIIWMVWECIPGLMEDVTWVNTKTTRSTATVSTSGPMVDSTLVNGCMESNMVSVFIRQLKPVLNMASGKKARE